MVGFKCCLEAVGGLTAVLMNNPCTSPSRRQVEVEQESHDEHTKILHIFETNRQRMTEHPFFMCYRGIGRKSSNLFRVTPRGKQVYQ
jgi:hypothetical protein